MTRGAGRWQVRALALTAILVPTLVGLGWWLWPSETRVGPVRGLVLGLGPAQARERLATDGTPGRFRASSTGEDFALDWSPTAPSPTGALRAARLEFHLGQLVAARLTLAPDAPEAEGPALELSEAALLARERDGESVRVTWIARSCPTHAPEVAARLRAR